MKKILFGLLLFSFGLLSTDLFAQNYSSHLKYRKFRVSFVPPISTNGTKAVNYSAKYSLNVLVGYNGALDGYEIGALVNYNKYYSSGFQLAGLANLTDGDMEGFNISGVLNYSKDDMAGIQLAGIANISEDMIEGIQASSLLNYSRRGSSGMQFSGGANVSESDLEGVQIAGIFNFTKREISGLQGAGVFNFAGTDVEGLQAAGAFNIAADDLEGLQAAGIGNIAMGNIEGLLASGFLNYAHNDASGLLASGGFNIGNRIEGLSAAGIGNIAQDMEGLQFGGFNLATKAVGVQVGILNIAKEFEGVSIGLISLYGNGRKNIETRFSDGGFAEFGITTGTHRVYNAFLFGYNTILDRNVYRIGLAVGLEKNIQDSFENRVSNTLFVNQEFSVMHHFEEKWTTQKNRIFSYKYMIGNRFGNGFSIYGGPSLNMQVTRVNDTDDYTWYSFWSPTWKGRQYRFWAGFTVGVRIFKQKNLPLINDEYGNNWGWSKDWEQ